MNRSITRFGAEFLAAAALAVVAGNLAEAATCAHPGCAEVRSFTATVTSLRSSKQGANRVVALGVRFQNKTDKALTLGYVNESGTILDEKGNRYDIVSASGVRGIGVVDGTAFDPKFTLQPKESSDARFELVWKDAGSAAAGTKFDLDLAIREIVPTTADQFKLGQEHALHYAAINEAALAGTTTPATTTAGTAAPAAAASATAAAKPAAPTNPCAGAKNCYNAGAFIAQVQQLTPSNYAPAGRHHSVKLNIRFTNISNAPIILGYKASTSLMVDNLGNGYYWGRSGTHDTSAQGIGLVVGRSADPQFVLNPGQSRAATFGVTRYNVNSALGNAFQYDVVISELEVLNTQQVRTLRENSLNYVGLTAGSFSVAQAPGQIPGVGDVPATQEGDVAKKVIDLFNAVKKKPAPTPTP